VQLRTTLLALLVVSGFAVAVPATPPGGAERPSAATASTLDQAQQGQVTGQNATFQNVSLRNVTLRSVAVTRLVVNATRDGSRTDTTLRNVTATSVEVGNATIRNATFGRLSVDQRLATDLVGRVGTGVRPDESLPSQPLEAQEIADRTLVGVEFGTLRIANASLGDVTVEDRGGEEVQNIQNATLSGRDVTLDGGSVQNVTVVGLTADEASNGTTDS